MNIVLQGIYPIFLRVWYEKKSYLNWMVDLQVWQNSQLIFLPKPGFLYFIWIISDKNNLKFYISRIQVPKLQNKIH